MDDDDIDDEDRERERERERVFTAKATIPSRVFIIHPW